MLLWIDLETTGLDPKHDKILEIAIVQTDDDLNVRHKARSVVWPAGFYTGNLDRIVNFCQEKPRQMHTENGLFDDIRRIRDRRGDYDEAAIEHRLCARLNMWMKGHESTPLCGSSVHFDRRFLERYMPDFLSFVTHHHVDVSSIRALQRRWQPTLNPPKPYEEHRALPDILQSIDRLRWYREQGFVGTGLPLDEMTPNQRMQVFSRFCKDCGIDNPNCQCWNDE